MVDVLEVAALVCGWGYFLVWSISFYFQPFLNWRRKSVVGFSFDYLLLNIVGFTCYSLYNGIMYFSSSIQDAYRDKYNSSSPVSLADVAFAFHALVLTLFQTTQCFFYDRGTQVVAKWNLTFCIVSISVLLILSVFAGAGKLSWIFLLQCFGFMKAIVSFLKYAPQAWLSFRRKCTVGFSIHNVWCDFSGGALSFLQMVIEAIRQSSASQIFGNPGKFALSVESQFFDTIFLVQHYILYRGNPEKPMRAAAKAASMEILSVQQDLVESAASVDDDGISAG